MLFRFPQEESGKFQKLSRLWHGPYIEVVEVTPTGIAGKRVYTSKDDIIHVHLNLSYPSNLTIPLLWKKVSSGQALTGGGGV